MALTLTPAALLNAQDSQSRHPIVEIVSSQATSDIPFDGQLLTEETTNESKPNVITHSTNRLCQIYLFGTTSFKYVYTDINRQEFNFVTITPPSLHTPIEATLCELANGNIGIVYICSYSSPVSRQLRYLVISPEGVVVTADTQIGTDYAVATYLIDMPFVIRLINGTFLLVYYHKTVSGATYQIKKRTCPADFITWSAESECVITGTDLVTTKPRYNPSLMQITVGATTGDIFLWFDYMDTLTGGVEITNVYYSISTNNGVAWTKEVKLTTYATTTAVGKHPVSVQKVANEMMMSFSEVRPALFKVSHDATMPISDITFDPVGRKVYAVLVNGQVASGLYGVMEIDIDTWTPTNWWDEATDPAFDPGLFYHGGLFIGLNARHHGEYPYIPVGVVGDYYAMVDVLNVSADTITHYYFRTYSWAGYSIVQNVTGITLVFGEEVYHTWVDATTQRLYVLLGGSLGYGEGIRVGYIEIGTYEWHEIVPPVAFPSGSMGYDVSGWIVDTGGDRIFISTDYSPGELHVYSLSSGGLIKIYKNSTHPTFPLRGLHNIALLSEKIVGLVFDNYISDPILKGVAEIDLTTQITTMHQPDWGVYTDYWFRAITAISSEEVAILSWNYGLTIFNITTHVWTLINNANVPGLTPNSLDYFAGAIAYDPVQEIIFAGTRWGYASYTGIVAVSRYGAFKGSYYKDGVYSAGWTFGIAGVPGVSAQLVAEWTDYDLVMAVNPSFDDLSIYAFWTKILSGGLSIKWDLEGSSLEISDYIVNGTEVQVHRSIDGGPASLSFICSHGQIFDPQNIRSLYSIYLKKGRKLNLRFGDKVGVTEYWQQQGVFLVTSTKLSYERGQYPVINIMAEDERIFWEQGTVTATAYYETDPKTMLEDLLVDIGGFTLNVDPLLNEIIMPSFDGACTLWFQWIDTPFADIVMQICEHFGYFPRIDVDGKVTARKISGNNAVNHTYSDSTKLINFTPDDDFSDFTNQIIVTGQSHYWLEVLFAEEAVGSLQGAAGWWHKRKNVVVWYSPDHMRTCRNARMEVIESVRDGPYFCKKGHEWLFPYVSDYYCAVRIDGPDLVGLFITALVIYLALLIVCAALNLVSWIPIVGGAIKMVCAIAAAYAMFNLMSIVGTQGAYSYNFYAQPVGHVRESFQAMANDEVFQSLIGKVIFKTINDPLCFSVGECQLVADFNRDVMKWQRNRMKFTKIADLRDEEGDMIQVPHPYTLQSMKTFITEITRRFQKSASPGSDDGYFLDDIEGWRII
jgi:hypothetical protein